MKKIFFVLFLVLTLLGIISCSVLSQKIENDQSYQYSSDEDYSINDLKKMSPFIIESSFRRPPVSSHEKMFGPGQAPLKRVGIIVFESLIQPTYSGLSGEDLIYPTPGGRQMITENLLQIWEEVLPLIMPETIWVPTEKIFQTKASRAYGHQQKQFHLNSNSILSEDEIFYITSGKKMPSESLLGPRHMQDLSFLAVGAAQLMEGPKWSEHQKHFVNEVSVALNLDAVLVLFSQVSWTSSRMNKTTLKYQSSEIDMKLSASLILPFSAAHKRLRTAGEKEMPYVNFCYGHYRGSLKIPFYPQTDSGSGDFDLIKKDLLTPVFKSYNDLTKMMILNIKQDLNKSW